MMLALAEPVAWVPILCELPGHSRSLQSNPGTQWHVLSAGIAREAPALASRPMAQPFSQSACAPFTDEEEAKEVKHMARAGRAGTGGQCRHAGQAHNRALGLRHGRRSEHRIGRCEQARSDVNLWSGK